MSSLSFQIGDPSGNAPTEIVNEIIQLAKANGLDQATLAAKSGITPESLSRLKKEGRCRLSTVLSLARAAGLSHLELREPENRKSAVLVAARKLSSGRRREIDSIALLQYLSGEQEEQSFTAHLIGFFEELPVELIHDIVLDEGLTFSNLASLAKRIGAEGETVDWIQEMAHYSMA